MRVRLSHIIFLLATMFASTACNDASQLAGSKKSGGDKDKDDEDDEANVPVEVSGAYLICDWLEPESTAESTLIGCSVVDANGQAFDRKNRNFDLTLHNADDSKAEMLAVDTSEDSNWHKLAQLPSTHKNTGYLKMTMRRGVVFEGSFMLNTVDIGTNVTLGNEMSGEGMVPPDATGIKLTSITSDAFWTGAQIAIGFGINPSDFCNDDGSPRTALSQTSTVMVKWSDKVLKSDSSSVPLEIDQNDTDIPFKSATCFNKFKIGGTEARAHKNSSETCYLLISGPNLHIINAAARKATTPDLTLENLRAFADKKYCEGEK